MATPVDIQAELDKWLASNPEAQKYIEKLYYVPDGAEVPAGVTHLLELRSQTSPERALLVGIDATPEAAAFADAMLALVATQPPKV